MKRREFLNYSLLATTVVGKFGLKPEKFTPFMQSVLGLESDRVLVIIELNGGNDGLNTIIPLDNYSGYFNARKNIAIPESKILKSAIAPNMGFHPAMTGFQSLFNEGKLSVIHSVGYPNPNFSHFRSQDIWMSASDSNTIVNSGWAGRYLNKAFPGFPTNYPNADMPDPLAVRISSVPSLLLQGPSYNMAMNIGGINAFYLLANGETEPAPDTNAGRELSYLRLISQQTEKYSEAIKTAASKVTQQGVYPDTSLAQQLKIVARLIKGGLKTRVYMVNMGGFDTHSLQAVASDPTLGAHANLLRELSDAIKAFMDDCKLQGIDNRVMGMTFSEFGRRIMSNSSIGTDHGEAAPMFVFGAAIKNSVVGTNPVIPTNVTVNDNIPFQFDFRSVYSTIMKNWFCSGTVADEVLFKEFPVLPIIQESACSIAPPPPPPPPPPAALTLSITNVSNVTTYGGTNGAATANVTGGVTPYGYSWNTNPIQTTQTVSNLAAGTYTVTVKDAANTSVSASITITQPPAPPVTTAQILSVQPNPFQQNTTILYRTDGGPVTLTVFSANGTLISTLVNAQFPKGDYSVTFKGRNLPPATYYVRLQNGTVTDTKAILKTR
jgi:uncharacterized protein (DUF1501 family)